ncbi:MAG: antibiotic biosynthesis monooxygenase [Streptosporangiales bacterium]|nr:antibiotic biosynthesis monooxygenase [Streptosporangiales bacterium]
MAVVKINALEVAEGQGEELERRFAERAGEIETAPGFLGFELLRPVEGETRYFVCTRWESDEAFQAWVNSEEFKRGHAKSAREGSGTVAHGSSLLAFEVVLEATPRTVS